MRTMQNGRIRRTKSEWKKIIHKFLESGLNAKEFCRREKLDPVNLARWRRQVASPPAAKFVPVIPQVPEPPTGSSWELEVSLPGGVHLQFRG